MLFFLGVFKIQSCSDLNCPHKSKCTLEIFSWSFLYSLQWVLLYLDLSLSDPQITSAMLSSHLSAQTEQWCWLKACMATTNDAERIVCIYTFVQRSTLLNPSQTISQTLHYAWISQTSVREYLGTNENAIYEHMYGFCASFQHGLADTSLTILVRSFRSSPSICKLGISSSASSCTSFSSTHLSILCIFKRLVPETYGVKFEAF